MGHVQRLGRKPELKSKMSEVAIRSSTRRSSEHRSNDVTPGDCSVWSVHLRMRLEKASIQVGTIKTRQLFVGLVSSAAKNDSLFVNAPFRKLLLGCARYFEDIRPIVLNSPKISLSINFRYEITRHCDV